MFEYFVSLLRLNCSCKNSNLSVKCQIWDSMKKKESKLWSNMYNYCALWNCALYNCTCLNFVKTFHSCHSMVMTSMISTMIMLHSCMIIDVYTFSFAWFIYRSWMFLPSAGFRGCPLFILFVLKESWWILEFNSISRLWKDFKKSQMKAMLAERKEFRFSFFCLLEKRAFFD